MSLDYHPLGYLLCGRQSNTESEINKILNHLNQTISKIARKLLSINLLNEDEREVAPFFSRTIFEAAATALLARIDPFRVLTIYKVQQSPHYDVTKKSNIALQWTGDIIAASRPKDDLWNPENKLTDYDRALLGNYYGELFWKPSFLNALDYISNSSERIQSEWVRNLEQIGETPFFERAKTEARNLFSALSKGVHYEFLVNTENIYDATTVQDFILRMLQTISDLGLISHFGDLIISTLDKEEAIDYYLEIEELVKSWRRKMNS